MMYVQHALGGGGEGVGDFFKLSLALCIINPEVTLFSVAVAVETMTILCGQLNARCTTCNRALSCPQRILVVFYRINPVITHKIGIRP